MIKFVMLSGITAAAALCSSGCAGHADIPEFTTSSDRDTGFVPSTSLGQDGSEGLGSSEVAKEVEEGVADVKSQSSMSSEYDQFSEELDEGIKEAQKGISEFVNNQ